MCISSLCSLIIFNSSNIWKDSAYDDDYPSDGARYDLGPESSDKSPMIEILSKYENYVIRIIRIRANKKYQYSSLLTSQTELKENLITGKGFLKPTN